MGVKFSIRLIARPKFKPGNLSLGQNGLSFKGDNGSCVILIHGLTGTPNEMSSLANFLHKKGYSVICPRLANHGEPIEVLKTSKWQDFYLSVREPFLKEENSYRHIYVAGLSMGALLALMLALEFPERISGVSCLSPTLFYDGWNTPWTKCFLPLTYITPLKHFFYFKEEPPYGIKNEAIRAYVHKYYQKADLNNLGQVGRYGYPFFPVTLFYQLHLLKNEIIKKLKEVSVPVQLCQAKEDDMTSVKNSQFIYDRINSKLKEIVLFYNSYHVITADQERDNVAEAMEGFFRRCIA